MFDVRNRFVSRLIFCLRGDRSGFHQAPDLCSKYWDERQKLTTSRTWWEVGIPNVPSVAQEAPESGAELGVQSRTRGLALCFPQTERIIIISISVGVLRITSSTFTPLLPLSFLQMLRRLLIPFLGKFQNYHCRCSGKWRHPFIFLFIFIRFLHIQKGLHTRLHT